MFSTDILLSLNEQNLFFFPKNINNELDLFNRHVIHLNEQSLYFFPMKIISSKMFSTDILIPLNGLSLFFFPKNINKELDIFNRYFILFKWKKFIFHPQEN